MPCFEGPLLEPHNTIVQDVLFTSSNWHGHGKLRLHTDSTVGTFRLNVRELGKELRRSVKVTCNAFDTKDTPQEVAKRQRAALKHAESTGQPVPEVKRRKRTFNMLTPKLHSLGDYPLLIPEIGSSDNFSTKDVWSYFSYMHTYSVFLG